MSNPAVITVVDDDQSIRDALPKLLRSFGFAAHAFASGEDFLNSSLVETSDCLILDIAMPGMSGPDLHQELKRRKLATPVIFITAHGNETLRDQLLAAGATAYLDKPFDPSVIVSTVQSALAKS